MSEELTAFKMALREAGQPWSGWGIRAAVVGVGGMLLAQVAPGRWSLPLMLAALAVVVVGWVLLIVAHFKRTRWAKSHHLHAPPPDLTGPNPEP